MEYWGGGKGLLALIRSPLPSPSDIAYYSIYIFYKGTVCYKKVH